MKGFILRLDDACKTMDWNRWDRITNVLDQYEISPILGIIPDCQDPELRINNTDEDDFWKWCCLMQNKGWIIAQHGYQHKLHQQNPKKNFQKAVETWTEFSGVSIEKQEKMVREGRNIMLRHGIIPTCFFAPCHTFDLNTIKVLQNVGGYDFVSDGYSFQPYIKEGMVFIPAPFDSFHVFWGLQTFVLHPNNMCETEFDKCEIFLKAHKKEFLTSVQINQIGSGKWGSQGIVGHVIERLLYSLRVFRNSSI